MKSFTVFILSVFFIVTFNSCIKQEYFKSESEIKKELKGTWTLIPIPRYDTIGMPATVIEHFETWTFDDSNVTIVNNNLTSVSAYSVHTTISKAEFTLDGIVPEFVPPARVRNSGTWRIVKLDDGILSISSDKDGTTGLTQLEFRK